MFPFDGAGNLVLTTLAVVKMLADRLFSSYWALTILVPLVYQGVRSRNLAKARQNLEDRQ